MSDLSPSAQRVQAALAAGGFTCKISELPNTTRTAVDAANAVGCQVGQIVKSLVFKTRQSQRPILVVASGANRVDEKKIGALLAEPIRMADPQFVRQKTGYAIGGVPPMAHTEPMDTFIDEDLLAYEEIWAAAGNPNALFKLSPRDLVKMTGGRVTAIC